MADAPTRDTPMMVSNTQAPAEGDGPSAESTSDTPRAIRHRPYKRMLKASQPTTDPTDGYTLFGMNKEEARAEFDSHLRERLNNPEKLQQFSQPANFQRAAERFMTAADAHKAAKTRLGALKTDLRAKLREYEENKEGVDESFDREYGSVWEALFVKIKETEVTVEDLDKAEGSALQDVRHIINGEVVSRLSRAQVSGPFWE
ncbi:hypothetical protein NW768_007513 [Fusarium equiseti]|uniref:Uncharacterized protein n=1 Tax=Fusarium equiseti TaxID=61235 RepID=A0ABQ8R7V3_FUSEQ|nr:hypothetical protein NW768_007513 [Fusarium equiseti]